MMNKPTGPDQETGASQTTFELNAERRPRLIVRLIGLVMVIFSVVVATYLVVAYFAFESGRALGVEQQSSVRATEIARQIELAREDLSEGSNHLAQTRLEWVLSQEPDNQDALALRAQTLADHPETRQPEPTALPTEDPGPETEAPPGEAQARRELQAIRRLVAAKQWEDVLPRLLAFQYEFPDYERGETDQMLYDTYLALGRSYINSEKIELALNYFSQAERLGNLPQEAIDYRVWADLYFQGIAYSGVNWEIASGYWRDLCAAAPFFRDSCERFELALVGYGDQLAYHLDWCPAASIYREAWNRRPSEKLEGKLNQALEGCAAATPIPITGTESLSGTVPVTGTMPLTSTTPGG